MSDAVSPADPAALDVQRIWADAVKLLDQVGLKVENSKILAHLAGKLPVVDGWVRFPPDVCEHFAAEIRRLAAEESASAASADDGRIVLSTSWLNYSFLDATGRRLPYDRQAVVRHTKLAFRLKQLGVLAGGVTGYPRDVPPRMQLLMPTYYDCLYNPTPHLHSVLHEAAQLRYLAEIGELFGLPLHIGTELVSPMKFVGDSTDIAFEFLGRDLTVFLDPMPILGVTAPMDWHLGFAQSVAENIGSYAIFRLAGFARVAMPTFRLFAPNMRAGMVYFSSPRHLPALLARRKVRAFFGLRTDSAEGLLVTAKQPDAQAAAEKMAACLLAATHGFRHLGGAGSLWLDEVFCPEQLLIDVEIARYVNAMRADFAPRSRDAVEIIGRGLAAGSFFEDDLTLDAFEDFIWRPELFDLAPPGPGGGASLTSRARDQAEALADEYDYELTGPKREQLERIMARAAAELT